MFAYAKDNGTDLRLIPLAMCCWAITALCLTLPNDLARWVVMFSLTSGAVVCATVVCAVTVKKHRHAIEILTYVLMCIVIGMCAALSTNLHKASEDADIVSTSSSSFPMTIRGTVRITDPILSSTRRGFACSAVTRIENAQIKGIDQNSHTRAVFYIKESSACEIERGAVYTFRGKIDAAKWGKEKWWVDIEDCANRCLTLTTHAPRAISIITAVQNAFLTQTRKLDISGRILVPGVTLGVLGNDAFASIESVSDDYGCDAQVAKEYKESFKTAGIMHVLAVSGGHFALAAGAVEWLNKRAQVPRIIRGLGLALSIVIISVLMYPSDSLVRAQIMGIFSLGYVVLGRRSNPSAALCWMIIAVLIIQPHYATSIGFMLSCAAVFGIFLGVKPLTQLLDRILSTTFAQMIAVTLCAQVATLPISIAISGQIPVYAVLANVLITIPMDIATIFAIAGLLIAWVFPAGAYVFVWCASVACSFMAQVCSVISNFPGAIIECSLLQLCVIYGVIGVFAWGIYHVAMRVRRATQFNRSYRMPLKLRWNSWWKETVSLIFE